MFRAVADKHIAQIRYRHACAARGIIVMSR
jgi:hypothetical protein